MPRQAAAGLSWCCCCYYRAFVDDRQSSVFEHAEAFEHAETALPARHLNGPLPPTIYGPIREHDVCGRRIIVRPTRDGCYLTFKTVFFRRHLTPTVQLWFHTSFITISDNSGASSVSLRFTTVQNASRMLRHVFQAALERSTAALQLSWRLP